MSLRQARSWGRGAITIRLGSGIRIAALALAATLSGGSQATGAAQETVFFRIAGVIIVWGADDFGAAGAAPVVSDFIIDTGTGGNAATSGDVDLIATDVHTVTTGTLTPTPDSTTGTAIPFRIRRAGPANGTTDTDGDGSMDADDTFDAFQLRQNSDLNLFRTDLFTSFFVASNTPFNIDAQASPVGDTTNDDLDRVRLRLRVTQSGNDDGFAFGSAAQFPNSAGADGGGAPNGRRLSVMTTPSRVFQGDQRTAAAPGTIAEQSVRFDLRYRLGRDDGYDLSDGVANIEALVVYTVYAP